MIYMTDSNGNLIPFTNDNQCNGIPLLRYVIETYQGGTEGYIIYNDGWCEQWGLKTSGGRSDVIFLKEFKDTNYNLLVTDNSPTLYTGGSVPLYQFGYTTKTTTGFNAYADGNLYKNWRAFGYLADGEYTPTQMAINANTSITGQNLPYLIDSWESSDHKSFYRIYSDGFKECGGYAKLNQDTKTTITLPISFTNTEYIVTQSTVGGTNTDTYLNGCALSSRTTSQIVFRERDYGNGILYHCMGY